MLLIGGAANAELGQPQAGPTPMHPRPGCLMGKSQFELVVSGFAARQGMTVWVALARLIVTLQTSISGAAVHGGACSATPVPATSSPSS